MGLFLVKPMLKGTLSNGEQVMSKGKIEITCDANEYLFWETLIETIYHTFEKYRHDSTDKEEFKKLTLDEIKQILHLIDNMPRRRYE